MVKFSLELKQVIWFLQIQVEVIEMAATLYFKFKFWTQNQNVKCSRYLQLTIKCAKEEKRLENETVELLQLPLIRFKVLLVTTDLRNCDLKISIKWVELGYIKVTKENNFLTYHNSPIKFFILTLSVCVDHHFYMN